MILLTLFFSCIIEGYFAFTNDHCNDPNLEKELQAVSFLPGKEQMRTLCPKVLTFFECEKDLQECPGQSLEEMAFSSDRLKALLAKALVGGIDLINDLCDEDSSFHRDYLENVDCFKGYILTAPYMCPTDTEEQLEKFFEQYYNGNNGIDAERHCLSEAIKMECLVSNLGKACGSDAERTLMRALEKMQSFLKAWTCENVENPECLKSKFMKFLKFSEQRKTKIQNVFDLIKRR